MSPPGQTTTRTTPSGERITAGHDLETQNGQRRYLSGALGISQREARVMLRTYAAERAAERTPSFQAWIERVMQQAPGPGRQRGVLKHNWRVAS